MATKLLEMLPPLFGCPHQFSWPRRDESGEYYQVCLRCGAEYGYDWSTMRRTDRREITEASAPERSTRRPSRTCSSWKPRARRLTVEIPVQYRQHGTATWQKGTVRNISRSGVLFEGTQLLPPKTALDMIFEMPAEITGQNGSRVLCTAAVVRTTLGEDDTAKIAASIAGYEFLA